MSIYLYFICGISLYLERATILKIVFHEESLKKKNGEWIKIDLPPNAVVLCYQSWSNLNHMNIIINTIDIHTSGYT